MDNAPPAEPETPVAENPQGYSVGTEAETKPQSEWKELATFLLKLAVFLGGLAVFGLAVYWLRRTLS